MQGQSCVFSITTRRYDRGPHLTDMDHACLEPGAVLGTRMRYGTNKGPGHPWGLRSSWGGNYKK